MEYLNEYLPYFAVPSLGALGLLAMALFFKYLKAELPGRAKEEVLEFLAYIKSSSFLRPGAHCLKKRRKWVLATLELLECELPDPGEGRVFYIDAGNAVAGLLGRLVPFLRGTGQKWAEVLEEVGDEVDPALDKAIVERGGEPEK